MKAVVLIGIFLLNVSLYAQKIIAETEKQIPLEKQSFAMLDHIGTYYEVRNNDIFRIFKEEPLRSYKNPFFGTVSYLDIRNPLQILVYYQEAYTIVLLDNQLSEINIYNLSKHFPEIDPVYISSGNKNLFWVYDKVSRRIGRMNLMKLDFLPLTTPLQEEILFWSSDANFFYWLDDKGFHETDIYGKLIHTSIPKEIKNILGIDSRCIYYNDNNILKAFHITEKKNMDTKIQLNNMTSFFLHNQKLTIFTDREITIYNLKIE